MATVPTAEYFDAYHRDFEGTPTSTPPLTPAACSAAPSTAQAHGGTKSLAITPTGATNDSYIAIGGDFQTIALSGLNLLPNKAYRFTGWRYVPVGVTVSNSQAPVRIYLDTGPSTTLRTFAGRWVGNVAPAAGTWGQYECVFYTTWQATTVQRISLRIYHGGTAGTVYWDDLSLMDYATEAARFYLWYISNTHLNTMYGGTNDWHAIDYITSSGAEPASGAALTTVSFGTDTTVRTLTIRPITASTTNPTTGDGWVILREYLGVQTGYNRLIPAGVWGFRLVLRVTTAQISADTTLSARVYRVSAANGRTLLFTATDAAHAAGLGYAERVWSSAAQPRYILGAGEAIEIVWMVTSRGVAVTGQTFHLPMDQETLALGGNATPAVDVPLPGIRTEVYGTLVGTASATAPLARRALAFARSASAAATATRGPLVPLLARSASAASTALVARRTAPAPKVATVTPSAGALKLVVLIAKVGTVAAQAIQGSMNIGKRHSANSLAVASGQREVKVQRTASVSAQAALQRSLVLSRHFVATAGSAAQLAVQFPQSVLNRILAGGGAVVKRIFYVFDD